MKRTTPSTAKMQPITNKTLSVEIGSKIIGYVANGFSPSPSIVIFQSLTFPSHDGVVLR